MIPKLVGTRCNGHWAVACSRKIKILPITLKVGTWSNKQ